VSGAETEVKSMATTLQLGATSTARSQRGRFALGASCALAGVLALGWLTGLRGALHALLIIAGALAFFPFVVVALAVLLVAGASVVAALAASDMDVASLGAAEGIAVGGSKLARAYYGLLWRLRRHAGVWGAAAGFGLGVIGLLGVLWLFVVPRETQTLGILLEAQAQIEAEHRASRRYPRPAADGRFRMHLMPGERSVTVPESGTPLPDGFGRPISYQRDGSLLTASYRLASLGFDGQLSDDDICVSGRTRVREIMDRLREPLQLLAALRERRLSWREQAAALQDSRCSLLTEPAAHE
jgi:hypothetical protein